MKDCCACRQLVQERVLTAAQIKPSIMSLFVPSSLGPSKRIDLCRMHSDQWHWWRDLVYGDHVKPRLQGM